MIFSNCVLTHQDIKHWLSIFNEKFQHGTCYHPRSQWRPSPLLHNPIFPWVSPQTLPCCTTIQNCKHEKHSHKAIYVAAMQYNAHKSPHMKALLKAYDMQCMQLHMQLCASILASAYQRKLQLYVGLYLFLNVNSSIIKLDTLSKILNHSRWAYNYNQI